VLTVGIDGEFEPAPSPGSADEYLSQALLLEERGEFPEALSECEAAIAEASRFLARVCNLRGVVLEELERPGEALVAYSDAVQLDPSAPEAIENLWGLERDMGLTPHLVTIATLRYSTQAHVYRGRLASEGIWAFTANEFLVDAYWHFGVAAEGGVKLQVRADNVRSACEILGIELPDDEDELCCPMCGSVDVRGPLFRPEWECRDCGHKWAV
jgi:tetratricopeptide (TPR) repeat protein